MSDRRVDDVKVISTSNRGPQQQHRWSSVVIELPLLVSESGTGSGRSTACMGQRGPTQTR